MSTKSHGSSNFPSILVGIVAVNGATDETMRMQAGLSMLRSQQSSVPQRCNMSLSFQLGFRVETGAPAVELRRRVLSDLEFAHVFPTDPRVCCFLFNVSAASDSGPKQSELVALEFESAEICTHIYIQALALLGMVSKKRKKKTKNILKVCRPVRLPCFFFASVRPLTLTTYPPSCAAAQEVMRVSKKQKKSKMENAKQAMASVAAASLGELTEDDAEEDDDDLEAAVREATGSLPTPTSTKKKKKKKKTGKTKGGGGGVKV